MRVSFLIFGGFLLCSLTSCQVENYCFCVEPESDTGSSINPCPGACRPLEYYIANMSVYNDYTTFYFLNGTHLMNHTVMKIGGVTHLTLRGYAGHTSEHETGSSVLATVECEGTNAGFKFNYIDHLSIYGIKFNNCGYDSGGYSNAIVLSLVWNLCLQSVEIHNTRGVGIYGYEVVGNSTISNTVVSSSRRVSSNSSSGNMHFYYEYISTEFKQHSLNITNSQILKGDNYKYLYSQRPHAGGIFIYLKTTNSIQILMENIIISENSGYNGGNAAIDYIAVGNSWLSTITIQNCSFLHGTARGFGAGLYTAFISEHSKRGDNTSHSTQVLDVKDSHFEDNCAHKVGAGTYIQLHENSAFGAVANVTFSNCHFRNNYIRSSSGRGGSAVNIINFHIPDYIPHPFPQYVISFTSCTFKGNYAREISTLSTGSSAFYVEANAITLLTDCQFGDNYNCSGLSAVHSNLLLEGEIDIFNNTAVNGGGIALCANSIIRLSSNVTVMIKDNHATLNGGGIYTEFECLQAIPPCFYQVMNISVHLNKTVFLQNNTADRAGSGLYGGSIDGCYYYGPYSNDHNNTFNDLFLVSSTPNDTSPVSSNPVRVCLCEESATGVYERNCSVFTSRIHQIYSGSEVSVNVVVVGQRTGTVPGVVMAKLEPVPGVQHSLGHLQDSQLKVVNSAACTSLTYTVYSNISAGSNGTYRTEVINLSVQNSDARNDKEKDYTIYFRLHVLPCPPGFRLENDSQPVCKCLPELAGLKHIDCNISNTSIRRLIGSRWWIGYIPNEHRVVYIHNCPFDYCMMNHQVDLNATELASQNVQCAHNRSGTLCGGCQTNLSNVLGSSHCKDCSDSGFGRVLGIILLLAMLGAVLVLLIGMLNLSVTEGTLNAIVFYMNVVRVNTSFFDFNHDNRMDTTALKTFVAWINLDLGIELCFYNGMGAVGKTGLQFVFPLYLWCLSGLIIYCGRKSSTVIRLFGTNTVKVLATIILLSYAKLIRTVIDVWNVTVIESSHRDYEAVWAVDGNIRYFHHNGHTTLFIIAVVVTAVTLPYTLALLFIQCLRKKSDMKVLFWVNRLKPFFDAYTGPYKDRYHFWTGFLLIIRLSLFIGIAANGNKGPILTLTYITGTASLLLLIMQPGIYKNWALNILDSFVYFNLISFTALTVYDFHFIYNNDLPSLFCVGSMFLLFCGVVVYHMLKRLSETQRWRLMRVWLLDRKWPWMKRKPIRSLILPYIDPDSIDDLSSSDSELDPILQNAPPVARYDEYREPLIETGHND